MRSIQLTSSLAFAALASAAPAGPVKEPHFDILLAPKDGVIFSGVIAEDGSEPLLNGERVFGAELGEEFPNFSEEPGFQSPPATWPTGIELGFNVLDHLRSWNGVDFSDLSASSMTLEYGPSGGSLLRETALFPADPFVAGFGLPIEPDGGYHYHLDFTLGSPASAGIFLLTLEFAADVIDIQNSAPVFIVFNNGLDEAAHEAAIKYAREVLVPGPGPAAALAIGLGACLTPRRRRE